MKRLALLLLLTMAAMNWAAAQCTPDTTFFTDGVVVWPLPVDSDNTPCAGIDQVASAGTPYEFVFTFLVPDTFPSSFGDVPISGIGISTEGAITGLPASLDYECNPPNCQFDSNVPGCMRIFGTPTVDEIGSYDLGITATVQSIIPFTFTFPDASLFPGNYSIEIGSADTIYNIETIRENDASGNPAFLNMPVRVQGTVYGVSLRAAGNGISFTLIDGRNVGTHVFNLDTDLGYTVNEGDKIEVVGTVGFFNGLTEVIASSITVICENDSPLFPATAVTTPSEDTESQLVKLENVCIDAAQWDAGIGNGSGFNVDVTDADGNVSQLRIDNEVDLFNMQNPSPDFAVNVTGTGGQFDSSEPYDEGYQLFPRSSADIEVTDQACPLTNTFDLVLGEELNVFPNPTSDRVIIEAEKGFDRYTLTNMLGQQIQTIMKPDLRTTIDLSDLNDGMYILRFSRDSKFYTTKISKQ